MNKTFLFRLPSALGDFACADGEIASAENVRLRLLDGSEATLSAPDPPLAAPAAPEAGPEPVDVLKMPPAPVVRFSLQREVVTGWHNHVDNLPSKVIDAPAKPSVDTWGDAARRLFAEFERDAAEAGLFTRPFFVVSAVRLAGGERVLPSMPVLMLPQRGLPYVIGSDNLSLSTMQMKISAPASRLRMSVALPEAELPADAVLEVFVSEPIDCFHEEEWISYHRSPLTGGEPQTWRPRPLTEIAVVASMLGRASFRPVGWVAISDLAASAPDAWRDVPFNTPPVPDADGNFFFRPDYQQLQEIRAAGHTVISKRVTAWDLTLTPAAAPVVASLAEAESTPLATEASLVDMEMAKEGRVVHSLRFSPADPASGLSDDCFPSWLFFPDRDVRSVTIVTPSASYRFKTQPHPTLAGSYFACGDFLKRAVTDLPVVKAPAPSGFASAEAYESRTAYRLPDAVWRSGYGSTCFFPDSLLMRLDDARVIAVCRAFRASGLVATTAPTAYLFTSSGIYLLREMDDGSFRDAGLIAAYVLSDPSSILIDGRTLRFTDITGTPYLLTGTTLRPASSDSSSGSTSSGSTSTKTTVKITPENPELPIRLLTRPLKLEAFSTAPPAPFSAEASPLYTFELLCSPLEPSAESDPNLSEDLTMTLHGSADLFEWRELATAKGRAMRGLYLPGLRYARLELHGLLHATLEGVRIKTVPRVQ